MSFQKWYLCVVCYGLHFYWTLSCPFYNHFIVLYIKSNQIIRSNEIISYQINSNHQIISSLNKIISSHFRHTAHFSESYFKTLSSEIVHHVKKSESDHAEIFTQFEVLNLPYLQSSVVAILLSSSQFPVLFLSLFYLILLHFHFPPFSIFVLLGAIICILKQFHSN